MQDGGVEGTWSHPELGQCCYSDRNRSCWAKDDDQPGHGRVNGDADRGPGDEGETGKPRG